MTTIKVKIAVGNFGNGYIRGYETVDGRPFTIEGCPYRFAVTPSVAIDGYFVATNIETGHRASGDCKLKKDAIAEAKEYWNQNIEAWTDFIEANRIPADNNQEDDK